MQKIIIILIISVSFIFQSCEDTTTTDEQNLFQIENLELDNGKKWKVNKESYENIGKMKDILKEYEIIEDKTLMSSDIKENLKMIANRSRDKENASQKNLTIYLIPVFTYIDFLKNPEEEDLFKSSTEKLKEHLEAFDSYFTTIE